MNVPPSAAQEFLGPPPTPPAGISATSEMVTASQHSPISHATAVSQPPAIKPATHTRANESARIHGLWDHDQSQRSSQTSCVLVQPSCCYLSSSHSMRLGLAAAALQDMDWNLCGQQLDAIIARHTNDADGAAAIARLHALRGKVSWMDGDLSSALRHGRYAVNILTRSCMQSAQELCLLGQLLVHASLSGNTGLQGASNMPIESSEAYLTEAMSCFKGALEVASLDENVRACLAFTQLRLQQYDDAQETAEGSIWFEHPNQSSCPPHIQLLFMSLRQLQEGPTLQISSMPELTIQDQQELVRWAAKEIIAAGPLKWQIHPSMVIFALLLRRFKDGLTSLDEIGSLNGTSPANWSPNSSAWLCAAERMYMFSNSPQVPALLHSQIQARCKYAPNSAKAVPDHHELQALLAQKLS